MGIFTSENHLISQLIEKNYKEKTIVSYQI